MGFFKKIFKPIRKVLDKVVPNEIKPFLPYAAAAVPFLAPTSGIMGSMMGRAFLSGGANIASQLAQEGADDDINWLSALMAGGTGALSAPGASEKLLGMRAGTDPLTGLPKNYSNQQLNLFQKMGDKGLGYLAKGADFLSAAPDSGGIGDILRPGGTELTMKNALNALSVPTIQGTGDAMAFEAESAMRAYEKELAAYNAEMGNLGTDTGRREAILAAMRAYNHPEDLIESTLEELGLRDGGRVGLAFGGIPAAVQAVKDKTYKEDMALLEMDIDWVSLAQEFEETFNRPHQNDKELFDFYRDKYGADGIAQRTEMEESFTETAANGGIMAGRKPFVSGGLGKAMLKATNIVDETPSGLVDEFGAKLEYAPGSTSKPASEVIDTTKSSDNVTMRPDMLDYNVSRNPQGIAAREFIESIRRPDGTIDYAVAEAQIGRGIKLRGTESLEELIELFLYNTRKDKLGVAAIGTGYGAIGAGSPAMVAEAADGGMMDRKPFVSGGIGKGLMKLLGKGDDTVELAKQAETFKHGPITAKFMETVDEGIINPAIRTRDMGGSGGYGLYKNFEEMPAGLQAAELISRIKKADGTIDYKAAEIFIGRKLKGNETIDELIAMVVRPQNIADQMTKIKKTSDQLGEAMTEYENIYKPKRADGGIMNYNMGGSVLPNGIEVDYRGGGFIPMGSKERADDVPARVSKNEFVMTADAVRAAGGGSVKHGAKKMYELMNNLEARA